MLSEEEKKSIEKLNELLNYCKKEKLANYENIIRTVLNLITKQQNQIEKLKHSINIILSELPEDMDYKAIEKLLEE